MAPFLTVTEGVGKAGLLSTNDPKPTASNPVLSMWFQHLKHPRYVAGSLGLEDNAELAGGDLAVFFGLPSACSSVYFVILLISKDVPEDVLGWYGDTWMIVFISCKPAKNEGGGGEKIDFIFIFLCKKLRLRQGRPLFIQIFFRKIWFWEFRQTSFFICLWLILSSPLPLQREGSCSVLVGHFRIFKNSVR